MLRAPAAFLLFAALPLGLGGCLFNQPLTAPSNLTSPNLDSRLTGVFEYKEPAKKPGESDIIHRAAVLPVGPNEYVIWYKKFGPKPSPRAKFRGWLSRVNETSYLSIEDVTEGSPTFGKFAFARFSWEFPGNITLSAPNLPEMDQAPNPYRVRRALRAQLKAGSAFPFEPTYWAKIARIWWNPKAAATGIDLPPEFEKGATRTNPGL